MILDKINKPNDIKKIDARNYVELAGEIRRFLVEKTSQNGGHLASNLGVVELTMALHLCFDFPKDKLIWDVGHQAYTHKILSGRKEQFDTLRQYGGLSGFPKRAESEFDAFDTGHSTTSISAGMGLAAARTLNHENNYIVSVIGDGSLTGGMAYEALNNAALVKGNFIIVLNDNSMSISRNVGGVSKILEDVRSADSYYDLKEGVTNTLKKLPCGDKLVKKIHITKTNIKHMLIPNHIFEDMGLAYLGPVDGHDIEKLIKLFTIAKRIRRPVLVHVVTQKGRGYKPAVQNPSAFHGVGPFDMKTGKPLDSASAPSYSDIFSETICRLARKDSRICAITAAMPDGTGLAGFAKSFPERFFDVGIAEEHAVTFAAGLAVGGMRPVVAIYSSFLQRAYDQILHDVCIQKLPVVFAIDRAGLVGSDGNTHQGIFDLSYLSIIPDMTVIAPANGKELELALAFAFSNEAGPVAIRYPKGAASNCLSQTDEPMAPGKSCVVREGEGIAIWAVGSMMDTALAVCDRLQEEGHSPTLVNVRFVKPLDMALLEQMASKHKLLVTLEENAYRGGFGEAVCAIAARGDWRLRVLPIAFPDDFIEHGGVSRLRQVHGMDAEGIYRKIKENLMKAITQ